MIMSNLSDNCPTVRPSVSVTSNAVRNGPIVCVFSVLFCFPSFARAYCVRVSLVYVPERYAKNVLQHMRRVLHDKRTNVAMCVVSCLACETRLPNALINTQTLQHMSGPFGQTETTHRNLKKKSFQSVFTCFRDQTKIYSHACACRQHARTHSATNTGLSGYEFQPSHSGNGAQIKNALRHNVYTMCAHQQQITGTHVGSTNTHQLQNSLSGVYAQIPVWLWQFKVLL